MKQMNTYDHNTSIMMRLEVNYLMIATHIMLCLILNYLLIVGSIKYDRITPIIMRLEVNYLVIATHIKLSHYCFPNTKM